MGEGRAAIAAVGSILAAAHAQDAESAKTIMPFCRDFIAASSRAALRLGRCVGVIEGLAYTDRRVCAADGVTIGQVMRVVVQYIDSRPNRLH